MRALILPLSLAWGLSLFAQSTATDQGSWQFFASPQKVTAAIATGDDVWFAANDYLFVHYDREKDEINMLHRVFEDRGVYPLEVTQFWTGPQGRLHALGNHRRMAVLTEGNWNTFTVGLSISGLYPRQILRQEADGAYLFRAGLDGLSRWYEGQGVSYADDLLDLLPFNLEHTVWDDVNDRLWVARRRDLGYLKDNVFQQVDLPTSVGEIEQLAVDPAGNLWAYVWGRILCYRNGEWHPFNLGPQEAATGVSLTVLEANQALAVGTHNKYRLECTPSGILSTDHSAQLTMVSPELPLAVDADGCVWIMDVEQRRIGQWCGTDIDWRTIGHWLPDKRRSLFHVDVDHDGRVWIGNVEDGYYWSDGGWQSLQDMYPHSFSNVVSVLFRPSGQPIVQARFGTDPFDYYAYLAPNVWQKLAAEPAPATLSQRATIDQYGNLYSFIGLPTLVSILNDGEWSNIRSADLLPAATGILTLHITENGTQWLATEKGVYRRFGANYEFIPFDDPRIDPELIGPGRMHYSPSGTLWISLRGEVYTWRDGQIHEIPAIPSFEGENDPRNLFDIYAIADDDVWALLIDGSLANYNGEEWTRFALQKYVPEIRTLFKVVRDQRNRVWFHGSEALVVYSSSGVSGVELLEPPSHESDFIVYPNPASRNMTLQWVNMEPGKVQLNLYNSLGQLVQKCLDEEQEKGEHRFFLARTSLQAGVYYAVLQRGDDREVVPIVWK